MDKQRKKYIKQLSEMLLTEDHDEFIKIAEEIGKEEDCFLRDRIKEAAECITEVDGEIALFCDYTREELEYNTALEDAYEEGKAIGIFEGISKGKFKSKKEAAIAMIKENIRDEFISKITKLPMREIEMLRLSLR